MLRQLILQEHKFQIEKRLNGLNENWRDDSILVNTPDLLPNGEVRDNAIDLKSIKEELQALTDLHHKIIQLLLYAFGRPVAKHPPHFNGDSFVGIFFIKGLETDEIKVGLASTLASRFIERFGEREVEDVLIEDAKREGDIYTITPFFKYPK